ncbi:sensor domain-containing diguanylate cyclase [Pseudomonas sp. D1-3]
MGNRRHSVFRPLLPASGKIGIQAVMLLMVACLALSTFTGVLLYAKFNDVKASRHAELANLSASVLTAAESSITYASMILLGLAERYQHDGETPENLARMMSVARTQIDWEPRIQGIFFYAADGRWIVTTLSPQTPKRNNSDRDYFQYHLNNKSLAPYIGPPIQSRTTGEWIFTISIRLEDKMGEFDGVALATMRVESFLEYFRSFDLGANGIVSLARTDGAQLVRNPFSPELISVNVSGAPVAQAILAGSTRGVLVFDSPVDGTRRMVGYASSGRYPIRLSVGITEDYAYASWRRDCIATLIAALTTLAVIIFLGIRTTQNIVQKAKEETLLRKDHGSLQVVNTELNRLANEDGLTGLANRRFFDQTLSSAFEYARANRASISLLLLDIDYFKRYNDFHGHPAGDECLRRVSSLVKSCLDRSADFAARYGGEELAIILPHTDLNGALKVAEKIRQAVEDANIQTPGGLLERVTVSIGVSGGIPAFESTGYEEILLSADSALYLAKREGRNRVASRME